MATQMRCPWCVSPTVVIETRVRVDATTRRRRVCTRCARRFTTYQVFGSSDERTTDPSATESAATCTPENPITPDEPGWTVYEEIRLRSE